MSDRRGQLLLVGAIALAVIILGLSVVANTVLFTENVGTGEDRVESSEIGEFSFEAQKGTRSLLLRVNHANETNTMAELDANVRRQVTNYSDGLARMYASAGTKIVDISYNRTLANGTRIVQRTDRNFTYPDGGSRVSDWSLFDDPADVGWIVFNVDLRNTSGRQMTVNVSGDSETLQYRFNRSNGGDGAALRVTTTNLNTGATDTTACESTGGRVLFDLRRGEAFSSECTSPGIETLAPPYEISVSDGHNLAGQYDVVVDGRWHSSESETLDAVNTDTGNDLSYPHCTGSDPGPCVLPVVWEGQVDLAYRSDRTDFATTRNVTVYDP
ncbi:DUF7261 family protein [Halapricum hydrolyticum]|uniref:Uncharacterized protein n=1 Tax=Halapricum hydrolyticum TaxID=2979991 RepID=A0AAE3I8Q2_9EURY|nr:hypothetical protein [Halapricum hydrolyticum]MCU4716592.1 hypothetical protein [Halapricum hydrolyticum]MCU4725803.1 hypothetical protein [Halapricum hydrolyticum]